MWWADMMEYQWKIACSGLNVIVRVWITDYCKLSLLRTIYGLWGFALNLSS